MRSFRKKLTSMGSCWCSDCEVLSEESSTSMDKERLEQLGDAAVGRGRTGEGSANCAGDMDRDVLSPRTVSSAALTVEGIKFPTLTEPQLSRVSSPIESKLLYCLVWVKSVILVSGISSNRFLSDFSVTMMPSEAMSFWLETWLLLTSSVYFGSLLALAASEGSVESAGVAGVAGAAGAASRRGGGVSASGDGMEAPGVAGADCPPGAPSAVSRASRRLRI